MGGGGGGGGTETRVILYIYILQEASDLAINQSTIQFSTEQSEMMRTPLLFSWLSRKAERVELMLSDSQN